MLSEKRFVKNMNLLMLANAFDSDENVLNLFEKIAKHFPNAREELEHYCFILNFGKCGDEYEAPEELYKRLLTKK